MPYRTLQAEKIVATLETLRARIAERFPDSGLSNVCAELVAISRQTQARVRRIAAPNVALRFLGLAVFVGAVTTLGYVATIIDYKRETENLYGVLQGFDALLNTIVLGGAGLYFIASLESRWKRTRALEDLHQLRSIVHVIDMHQLTKDPHMVGGGQNTRSSPVRVLTPFQLTRYLDYCSEMLSLTSKVAALYAQSAKDPAVLAAVAELETLSANLSSKIWQKIMMIQASENAEQLRSTVKAAPAPAPARVRIPDDFDTDERLRRGRA